MTTPLAFGVPSHAQHEWPQLGEALNDAGAPAPCQGLERDYWQGDADEQRYAARACLDCPAMVACGRYATAADEPCGTWGGLTERERRKARKGAA